MRDRYCFVLWLRVVFVSPDFASQAYRKRYARDENEALPKSLMMGKFFCNSEQHFQKALDSGEISEAKRVQGVVYYSFRRMVVGQEEGKEEDQIIKAGKKLSQEEYSTCREVFRGLKWSFEFAKKEAVADAKGKLTPNVVTLLKQASATLEKTTKESKQLISEWSGSDDTINDLKSKYGPTINFASEIAHIRDLQKFSDGTELTKDNFMEWMKMVATKTDALNLCIQKARAEVKFMK